MKIKIKFSFADVVIKVFLILLALIALFPFYQTLLLSVSKQGDIYRQTVYLYPEHIDFSAYKYLLDEGNVLSGLFVTLFVTVVGTALSLALTTAAAYALSKKDLPGRKVLNALIIFTMYFSGGLIPYFLTVKNLGLQDNIFCMILPRAINTYNLILMRSFFVNLPSGLEEAAKIDGANDMQILFKIVLPVSKPIMATMALFYAVERWNEWYNGMLFLTDTKKYPLQLILRNTIMNVSTLLNNSVGAAMAEKMGSAYTDSIKSALIVITALPILMVYPKLQKYFQSVKENDTATPINFDIMLMNNDDKNNNENNIKTCFKEYLVKIIIGDDSAAEGYEKMIKEMNGLSLQEMSKSVTEQAKTISENDDRAGGKAAFHVIGSHDHQHDGHEYLQPGGYGVCRDSGDERERSHRH